MASGLNMFTNWTLKTFTQDGTFKTVSLSSDIVSGAAGAVIFMKNASGTDRTVSVRKTGSTDAITWVLMASNPAACDMIYMGVDGSRQIDLQASGACDFYVAGEIDSNGSFNTNAVDESSTTFGAWQTRNPTSLTTSPVAAFILIDSIGGDTNVHTRKTGSTDARQVDADLESSTGRGVMVGLDGNGDFDTYNEHETLRHTLYYMGDINAGLTMATNATDKSVDSPLDTFTDQDLTGDTAADADAAFFEVQNLSGGAAGQIIFRENGSTDDHSAASDLDRDDSAFYAVGLDSSQIHEWWIDEASQDWFLIGYASPIAAAGIVVLRRRIEGY